MQYVKSNFDEHTKCFILKKKEFDNIESTLNRVGDNEILFWSEYQETNNGIHKEFIDFALDMLSITPVDLDIERFFNIGSRIDKDKARVHLGDKLFELFTLLIQNWSALPEHEVIEIVHFQLLCIFGFHYQRQKESIQIMNQKIKKV